MRITRAATGSVLFFVVAPGVVAGLVPWWLTRWRSGDLPPFWLPLRMLGAALLIASGAALVAAFARFVAEGRGTPAPVAPTTHLVTGGHYRYVRNPMYVAVLALIIGQALLLGRPVLLPYAALVFVAVASFVRWYEEPTLAEQFGDDYERYRAAVPAWWPRLRPWRPDQAPSSESSPST